MMKTLESGLKVVIRKAESNDADAIFQLYKEVAKFGGGIARVEEEITNEYVSGIFNHTKGSGIMLVGIEPISGNLIAEIHASKYGIQIFDHILTNLTLVVHPDFQGKGIGKQIFRAFLTDIEKERPDIGRVELESRSSNPSAIALYKSLGFVEEGRMKNKTKNKNGSFQDSLLMAWMNPSFNDH
jgi:ribosomal protein S18 acetylase RimI-like enzyme